MSDEDGTVVTVVITGVIMSLIGNSPSSYTVYSVRHSIVWQTALGWFRCVGLWYTDHRRQ